MPSKVLATSYHLKAIGLQARNEANIQPIILKMTLKSISFKNENVLRKINSRGSRKASNKDVGSSRSKKQRSYQRAEIIKPKNYQ